jgi:hypothetical protein
MNIIEKINTSIIKSKILWSIAVFVIVVGGLLLYGYNQINVKQIQHVTGTAFSTTTNPYTYTDGNITFTIPTGWKQTLRSKGNVVEIVSSDGIGYALISGSPLIMSDTEKLDPSGTLINEFQAIIGKDKTFQKNEIAGKPSVSNLSSLWGKDVANINAVISNNNMYIFIFDASTTAVVSQLQPTFDSILKSISFK